MFPCDCCCICDERVDVAVMQVLEFVPRHCVFRSDSLFKLHLPTSPVVTMPKAAASKAVASKAAASARRCRGAAAGQLALAAPPATCRSGRSGPSGRSGWKSRNAKPRPYNKTGQYSLAWSKEIQAQPLKHLFGAFLAFLKSLPVTIHQDVQEQLIQTRCVHRIGLELAMCTPDLQPKETRWKAKLPQVNGADLGVDFKGDTVVITCIHAGLQSASWTFQCCNCVGSTDWSAVPVSLLLYVSFAQLLVGASVRW